MLKRVWRGWLRITEVIGNFQFTLLLTIIYWVLLPFVAIPFKFLADPLSIKRSARPQWLHRMPIADPLEHLRKQG